MSNYVNIDDGVPIVRCMDCLNRECDGRNGTIVCGLDGSCHNTDWFCADGEKKNKMWEMDM